MTDTKFLDEIRGALTEAPDRVAPMTKIPLDLKENNIKNN